MSDEWDQESEHRNADFQHLMDRMQSDYQNHVIESAEESLGQIGSQEFPMPNTSHPGLAQHAGALRSVAKSNHVVMLPRVQRRPAFMAQSDALEPSVAAFDKIVLTRKKFAGPAPFVGDARWQRGAYFWFAWVDDLGRHVAGDADLIIEPHR